LVSAYFEYTTNIDDYSDGKPQWSQFIHRTRNCSGNIVHIIFTGFMYALFKMKIRFLDPILTTEWERFSLMMVGESYEGLYTGVGEKEGFELEFEIKFDGGNDFFEGENVDPENFKIPLPVEVFYRDLPDFHHKPAEICFRSKKGWHKLVLTNKTNNKNQFGRIRYMVLTANYLTMPPLDSGKSFCLGTSVDTEKATFDKNVEISINTIHYEELKVGASTCNFYFKLIFAASLNWVNLIDFECCTPTFCHCENSLLSLFYMTRMNKKFFKNCTKKVFLSGIDSYTQFVYVSELEASICCMKQNKIIDKN
ncbi:hypothetical protein MXB_1538, partial [Myxobolus squamalis]